MKVEAYFRFDGNDKSIVENAIHKTCKSLTGFLSNVPDNWEYAFIKALFAFSVGSLYNVVETNRRIQGDKQ